MDERLLQDTIRRAQSRDADAFADLVREFQRPVRAFVASRSVPGVEIDEIAQRVFVTVFRRLDQFEPGTRFLAWLLSIAHHELLAETTRLKRRADYHTRYIPYVLALEVERRNQSHPTEEQLQAKMQFLQECVQSMRPADQEMIRWRYQEEAALTEIANRTARSLGAIKKHLHTLRRKLHDCIQSKLVAEGAS